MVPRPDTGNFNRFLTSMGLLLLLGALLLPYFFFHDTDTLRITRKNLGQLTPVAKQALESRQQRERDLEVPVLILAGALVLGGGWALWLGGRRLRVAQRKEDEDIDRKAKKDDFEFQQMSQTEVVKKREEQVRESVQEEEAEPTGPPAVDAPPQNERPAADAATRVRESRAAWVRVETTVKHVLEASSFASYDFLYEVKAGRGGPLLQLDGVFRSNRSHNGDVVLELKVVKQGRTIRMRLRQFADQLLALLARYERLSREKVSGWLVVVVPEEGEPLSLEERRRLEDQFNESLVNAGVVTIVHESELEDLPNRFQKAFEGHAK